MKEQYIGKIIESVYECDDVPLLDLICQLLDKSIQETA